LGVVDGYAIWRCPASAVDFVHPTPAPEALKRLYDRSEWFEAGERGGYASYDSQTDPTPFWLVSLLDRLTAERQNPSILDIGCAYGTHLASAWKKGWQAFGVEPSRHARSEARKRHPGLYVSETVEEIPPHRFDLILILDVIEHLVDPYPLFWELASRGAIGPETIVVVTTPNARSEDALADPMGWTFRHPPSHLVYYSATAFEELLRRLRFAHIKVRGQYEIPARNAKPLGDERSHLNDSLMSFAGLLCEASGSDFAAFMQERYVPGTWSEIAAYEHMPRYALARDLASGKRVLDFGSGSGYGASMLADTASSVIGLDLNEDAVAYARDHYKQSNLSFVEDHELGGSLPSGGFDLITCYEVIEHVDAEAQCKLIASLHRLLAPDGLLLISTPNPEVTANYGDNPYHLCELTRPQFEALLNGVFAHVELIEQSVQVCVSMALEGADGLVEVRRGVPGFEGESRPAAYVAVCSKTPFDALIGAIYPDLQLDYIKQRVQALRQRNRQLIDRTALIGLRASASRLSEAARESEAALAGVRAEKEALANALDAAQTDLIAAQSQLGKIRAECSAAEAELGATRIALNASQAELGAARTALNATQAELQVTSSTLAQTTAEFEKAAARLTAIERLRASAIARFCASAIDKARSPFRPVAHKIRDAGRRLRGVNRLPTPVATLPLATDKPPENDTGLLASDAKARDIGFECSLDPVWNSEQQRFELRSDKSQRANATNGTVTGGMKPYTVRPASFIDPTALRPKILHVIPNVYIGGSTQLIVDLVEHLSDRFQHEIVTSALCPFGEHEGLIVHHVPEVSLSAMAELYVRVKPAIIHVHYWGLTDDPWYNAATDAMAGLPGIMNINTPIKPMVRPEFHAYIFVSEYVRRCFGGEISDPGMISVIYPGIDLSRFKGPYGDSEAENAVGMVYRLEDDKLKSDAIDLFIEVVRRRPRTKVYIIGGGRFLLPYLEKTVAAGVRNNFRFTGYVPYEELPKWYDRFAVFAAPVWTESFGQVAPFAMRKRCAVAGYAVGALSEVLGGSETLGADLQETAEIVVALLNDPLRIRAIGRRNEERAGMLFDVRVMISRYRGVYDQVLAAVSRSS
jgi:2-polyprenyl-3-methyl-5-hydroxy-6-metoxy-1,4-benzoquinol methylase/glycosyltransferase involved in cell wall biosynthesis